jgi:hypothetical protein
LTTPQPLGYGVSVAHQGNDRPFDPGIRAILEELRDLRVEMRADRRQADAAAAADRRQAEADRREAAADRRRSDERFALVMREMREEFRGERRAWREESARQAATTQRMFGEIRTVGLAIVKTLNRHTRILERIDRKLGVRGNGRPGNGPRA